MPSANLNMTMCTERPPPPPNVLCWHDKGIAHQKLLRDVLRRLRPKPPVDRGAKTLQKRRGSYKGIPRGHRYVFVSESTPVEVRRQIEALRWPSRWSAGRSRVREVPAMPAQRAPTATMRAASNGEGKPSVKHCRRLRDVPVSYFP